VRTLETAVQAVYDDSSSLLLTTQVLPSSNLNSVREDHAASLSLFESVSSSLHLNLALVRETLEALLAVGHEQADLSQGDYNGSIEWRMSRLSMIQSQFGEAGRMSSEMSSGLDFDQESVVELADVFNHRPVPPPKPTKLLLEPSNDSSRTLAMNNDHTNGSAEASYGEEGSTIIPDPTEENEINETDTIDCECFSPHVYDSRLTHTCTVEPRKIKKPARPAGSEKLISILGNEYADKVAAESQPWFLRSNYNPSEILIDEADNCVRGGTVSALVEKLTAHDQVGECSN
jgi:son of sevenless-like protein